MIGTKTVIVMESNPDGAPHDWRVREWDTDIELMEGHTFNIARYLDEEGIIVD